jgi:hypothetical protein
MGRAADAMPVLSVPKRRGRRVDVPEPVFRFTRGILEVFASMCFLLTISHTKELVGKETSY